MKKSKNWEFWKIFFTEKSLYQKIDQNVSKNWLWYNTHQTLKKNFSLKKKKQKF